MESATIGQRIAQARREIPESQRELAERVGMSYSQLSRIEKGHNLPRPATIRELAAALGVNARWLASGSGPMRDGVNAEA